MQRAGSRLEGWLCQEQNEWLWRSRKWAGHKEHLAHQEPPRRGKMKEEVVWGRALTPQGRQREPVSGRIQVGFSLWVS